MHDLYHEWKDMALAVMRVVDKEIDKEEMEQKGVKATPSVRQGWMLSDDQIKVGSWWRAADGAPYGCVIMAVYPLIHEAAVLHTHGRQGMINTLKLQYRYRPVEPNTQ